MAESFIFPTREYGQENIKQIMVSVRKGNSAIIVGLPGVGKSTIARLLTDSKHKVWQDYLADTGKIYHFVHVDYSFNPDFREVMNQMKWELTRQGCSIPQGGDSFETLDTWFAAKDCSNRHFVLVFDGYDQVDQVQARGLLNRLRRLRNRQMNMSFLFVSRHEPETLYEIDELVDAVYYISPLNERDQRLTIKRHEQRLRYTFNDHQKYWLLTYCGGWPGFMKYMGDLLYDDKIRAADQVIPTCLADRRIKQICQEIWADLAENEKTCLIEAAIGRKLKNDELTRRLQTKHLLNRQGQLWSEIFKGFILSLPEAQPGICFWQLRPPHLLITAQGKTYNLKLTPKEAGLLTLLMEKSPAIVSPDEIQQSLWSYDPNQPEQAIADDPLTKLVSRTRLKVDKAMRESNFLSGKETSIENARDQGYRLNSKIRVKKDFESTL